MGKNKKHTIDGQLLSPDGTPIGREFSVNTLLVNAFPGLLPLTLPKDKIALVSRNFFGTPQSMMLTIFDTISKKVDANFSLGPFVPSKRYASCTLKNGNLLLVYQNFNQGMNVYVEMRSSQGEGLLKKKIALEGSISNQGLRFLITSLSNGNVVIVYYTYNQSTGIVVKGRNFSPKLEDLMRPFVACGAHDKKSSLPLLKELGNGNFIISCIQQNNDSFGIHGEVFSTRGRVNRRGFDIDTGPFTDIRYALTTTPIRNDIVVAWNKRVPDLTQSIKVRSFPSITGTKDREFSIAIESRFFGKTFEISPLKNGAFFLVWDTIDSTDIMSKKILLRDILSLLPRVQESALTAQECSNRKKILRR